MFIKSFSRENSIYAVLQNFLLQNVYTFRQFFFFNLKSKENKINKEQMKREKQPKLNF